MRALRVGLGLALLTSTQPLAASPYHVPYAKWGATPKELVTASKGSATVVSPPPKAEGLEPRGLVLAAFTAEKLQLEARFLFDPRDRLVAIDLMLVDPERCFDWIERLTAAHGTVAPKNAAGGELQTFEWVDEPAQEKLVLTRKGMKMTRGCTLRLAPVVKPPR